jgi:acetylornithine deacetylase
MRRGKFMTAAAPNIPEYVRNRSGRLIEILRELVARPSENRAPTGSELTCQKYVAAHLRQNGWSPVLFTPADVPGIESHPLYWPGRDYTARPNVAARRAGAGAGRSLILSGHVDTVPVGALPWTRDPFSGEIEGNRLFGRGANDMKAGIAVNLFVLEALRDLDIRLAGDLLFESVVDEEFGGVNGTLAGRLMGFNADASVITEPTSLRVCPAQRGGRTVHITFGGDNEGVLGNFRAGVIEQLRLFLNAAADFQKDRNRSVTVHPLYAHLLDPVPAAVTRVYTAAWGTSEPTSVPSECRVEFFWQTMPGETQQSVDREFEAWLDALVTAHPSAFDTPPDIAHPIRWLPGSAIERDHPLVRELECCAAELLGKQPLVQGIEGPCDMYVFHQFGIPAVLWGPRGGRTHNPDEYVEIDSVMDAAAVLLEFVIRWCRIAGPQ